MIEVFNILNLYAGKGGNREKWNELEKTFKIKIKVTAVELNPKFAEIYKSRFPDDEIFITDAHQYLLDHYMEFDFIWSSPPCQTHSRANYFINYITNSRYPDMKLWQEIIFLKSFAKQILFNVENVKSYYDYFIPPTIELGRHYLWSNFKITYIDLPKGEVGTMMKEYVGTGKHAHDKSLCDRNAVNSDLGLHILRCALGKYEYNQIKQGDLFQQPIG